MCKQTDLLAKKQVKLYNKLMKDSPSTIGVFKVCWNKFSLESREYARRAGGLCFVHNPRWLKPPPPWREGGILDLVLEGNFMAIGVIT